MRFPEWLYQLLAGDAGAQLLQVIWREVTSTAAATTVSGDAFEVPKDRCLILTNATMQVAPVATVTVNRRRIMADPPSGAVRYNIFDEETQGAVSAVVSSNWQGEVVIPGGWKVRFEASLDNALGGTVNGEIHGYLVPRGTFIF